jgi:PAS domain S-box-containing protein
MSAAKPLGLGELLAPAIGAFSLILMVLLWSGLFVLSAHEHERVIAETQTNNANLARAFEEHTARTLNYVDQIALLFKAQYERSGSRMDAAKFIDELHINRELINNVLVTDEHDNAQLGVRLFDHVNLGDREHVAVHHATDSGRLFIGKPVYARIAHQWLIVATRRINKADGSFGGVVSVAVNPSYFTDFYKQVDLGTGGVGTLVGRDGVIRARLPDSEYGAGRDLHGSELFRNLEHSENGSFSAVSTIDGQRRIFSYRALRDFPLVVNVGTTETSALAAAERNEEYYRLAAGLMSVIVLLSAWGLIALAGRQGRFAAELSERRSRLMAQQAGLLEMLADQSRSTAELAAQFRGITRQMARTLGVERVSIWQFTPQRRSIVCIQLYELKRGRDSAGVELAVGAFPAYFSALTTQSIIAADDAHSDLRTRELDAGYLQPNGIGSMLVAGIMIFGQQGGVVCCEHVGGTRHWTVDEQSFVLAASNLVSLAYERRERELAEKAANSAQAFLDSVIENIPDMIFIKDAQTLRFVRLNKAGEDLLGYPRDTLIGKNDRDLFAAEEAEFFAATDRETLAGRKVVNIEAEAVQTKNKGLRYLHTKKIPILGADGKARYLLGISEDITDRRLADAALRTSEARLKAVMDHSPALISLKDVDGRYMMINRPYAEMLKLAPGEVANKRSADLFPAGLAEQIEIQHEQVRSTRSAHAAEQTIDTDDGEQRTYLSVMFPLLDASGDLFAIGGVSTDITQRKIDEQQLQEMNKVAQRTARELATANRELEAFTYTVSHDLRAPLRHIDGFIDLLNRHAGPGFDEKSLGYVDRISRAAIRMDLLIDKLLVFSRMGRSEFVRKKVTMTKLIEEVVEEAMVDLHQRRVEWSIDDLPDVYGDPTLLRLAFSNLVDNAVKYTRRKEIAKIRIETVYANTSEAVFCVRDNGAGFDMQYIDKLFGVFQRLHGEQEFEGTGIGLASVARIIQRHGGRVWAESSLGEWAAFYVSIPVAEERRNRLAKLA